MSVGWDDEVRHDDAALSAIEDERAPERDRLMRRAMHYRTLLRRVKQIATEPGFSGGRIALMTPIGSYTVTVDAAGSPLGRIRFEPDDGKLKGHSVGPLIIDDPDVPAGVAAAVVEAKANRATPEGRQILGRMLRERAEADNRRRERESAAAWAEAAPNVRTRVPTLDADNPITMNVEAAAAAAAERYRPIFEQSPFKPMLSIGNKPATGVFEPADGVLVPYREEEIVEYTCLLDVAKDYEPGNPIYDEASRILCTSTGNVVVRVNRTTGEVRPRYITPPVMPPGWDPPWPEPTAEERRNMEIVRRAYEDAETKLLGSFRLPAAYVGYPPGRFTSTEAVRQQIARVSLDVPPRAVVELRAQLTEAGARMLATCGTCRGTGGDEVGMLCRTCRGAGAVAS
jgi:hypothetical protein